MGHVLPSRKQDFAKCVSTSETTASILNQNADWDAHIRRKIGAKRQRRMATEVWQTTKTKGKNLEECGLEKWT